MSARTKRTTKSAKSRPQPSKANGKAKLSTTSAILVKELRVLGEKVRDTVSSLSLCTPESATDEIKALWTTSTTTWPHLLISEDCWTVSPPNTTALILATLDRIEEKKTNPEVEFGTFRRGGSDDQVDPRLPVIQLLEPNISNPTAIIGLSLGIVPEGSFEAPLALSEIAEPFDQGEQSLLLTPKYWSTDLHLDSADGISAPMGDCVKIWITYPPTTKNLALMAEAEGQKAKLIRIGKKLEGGMIMRTDSTRAIYLPVGTLHAVYTLHGGYLVGIDLTTPSSSRSYTAMMGNGLDGDGAWQEKIFERFLLSIDLGLEHNQVALAIKAWVDAEEWIGDWAQGHVDWARDAEKIWEEHLAKAVVRKLKTCPCGKMEKGGSFADHFREGHAVKVPKTLKRKRSGIASSTVRKKKAKK